MRDWRTCAALSCVIPFVSAVRCDDAPVECHVVSVPAALTNGVASAQYLKLEPWQEHAVAHLRLALVEEPFEAYCSGVLVAERSVLTAEHCTHGVDVESVEVRFGPSASAAIWTGSAEVQATHPQLDLMLLALDPEAPAPEFAWLPPARSLPSGLAEGALVQLAGFGRDEYGAFGERSFLVEELVEVRGSVLSVSASGLAGACDGDSGGPLLVRADNGMVAVLGVLRGGAAGCFGTDQYTRVDIAAAWLEERIGPLTVAAARSEHQVLNSEGGCFHGTAVWADGDRIRSQVCDRGRHCGWRGTDAGYRCVASDADACDGITDVGSCDDGIATQCRNGRLERSDCAACGFSCARSPQTGRPVCVPSSDAGPGDELVYVR